MPYRRTQTFVWTQAMTQAFLAALGARPAAALLTTPTLILYTLGPPPTPGMTLSSYTEATFHGYAGVVLTLSAAQKTGGTDWALLATALFAATAGGTIAYNCLGYLPTDGATAVYGGEAFPAPVGFSNPGDFLDIDLVLPLPGVYTPTII